MLNTFFSSLLVWSCPVNTAAMPGDLQQNRIENFINVLEPYSLGKTTILIWGHNL